MQDIKFTTHKQYLFGRFFFRNAKKAYTDQSPQEVFFLSVILVQLLLDIAFYLS